jgi:hypothetical protein
LLSYLVFLEALLQESARGHDFTLLVNPRLGAKKEQGPAATPAFLAFLAMWFV